VRASGRRGRMKREKQRTKRKRLANIRCPWCLDMVEKVFFKAHVQTSHFPLLCTHCQRPERLHQMAMASPVYYIACEGATFVTSEAR
jgi:hypothetical protein